MNNKLLLLLSLLLSFAVLTSAQLSGTYYIGIAGSKPGGGDPDYLSLKSAIDALNTSGISGDVMMYFTSDLTEPSTCQLGVNTNGHTVTFKPYSTLTSCTITFNKNANVGGNAWFAMWVIGSKDTVNGYLTKTNNIIIDGSVTNGGTTRDLTLKCTSTTASSAYPIRIAGDCDSLVIKNCIITAAYAGGSSVYGIRVSAKITASQPDSVPDYITIQNNFINMPNSGAAHGIAVDGGATQVTPAAGLVIRNNLIVARTRGIFLNNGAGSIDIFGNEIKVNQTGPGFLSVGIWGLGIIGSSSVINIYNNNISQLATAQNATSGTFGIIGISPGSNGTWNIYNNFISGFATTTSTVDPNLANIYGISTSTVTANIFHNTISLPDLAYDPTGNSRPQRYAALVVNSGTVNLKDNIITSNEDDDSSYAVYYINGTLNSDYNLLNHSAPSGYIGFSIAAQANLAAWQTASSQDANSVTGDPKFVSPTDFHINTTAYPVSPASNAGTPIGMVTTDFDGDTRDPVTPDIGADEYTANPTIPIAGFSVSPTTVAFGNVFKDSVKFDSVTISNNSITAQLHIDSVVSTNSSFTAVPDTGTLDTSSSITIKISFSPTTKAVQSGKIIFYHNAPTMHDTVNVSGNGILKEAISSVIPASIDFHGVLLGKSSKDSVVIKNTGYDSLKISSAVSSNGSFVITPTTANLDTMESQKFYVTFTASSLGVKTGTIIFTSNTALIHDTVRVAGSGTSVVTIAESRKDANNDLIPDHSVSKDTLAIAGIITSPNFQGTQCAYFAQDTTGGIQIFSFTPPWMNFSRGDSVRVIGTVMQFHGLTEFTPLTMDSASFTLLKHNAVLPKAKHLTLHEFVTNPEKYEGQLVELDTLYKASGSWPASGSNGTIYITNIGKTDTTQLFIDLDTDIDGTTEPQYPVKVVGIANQYSSSTTIYNNGYEVTPRDSADISHTVVLGVNGPNSGIPDRYMLFDNYPNPFNPTTTIKFGLPVASTVTITVYDVIGREIYTMVRGAFAAGYHDYVWNARSLASGMYVYRIEATSIDAGSNQTFTQVKKLLLLK